MRANDYNHLDVTKRAASLLRAAQNTDSPDTFAKRIPEILAVHADDLRHADLAMLTASMQNFVIKYEHLLGRQPQEFPGETGGEVLWRLTDERRRDGPDHLVQQCSEALVDAERIIRAAVEQGMDIGQF